MKVCKFFLVIALFLGSFTTTHAQTSCLKYPSNSAPATDYGVSWDVASTLKELLVKSNCPSSGNSLDITVGKGSTAQFVWGTTYVYTGSAWIGHTLAGTPGGDGWLIGIGNKTITTPFTATPSNPLFFVGYVCTPSGSGWKCGCRNASCTTKHWQLQGYMGAGGGGTTGGTVIPSPTEVIEVSSQSEFSNALATAQAGYHIVLKNGTYNGFTISRSGQSDKPIVVRAENTLGAQIQGDITLSGNYTWAIGLDVTSGGSVKINGTGNRISSSRLRSSGASIIANDTARSATIDHNEIDSQALGTSVGWFGVRLNYATGVYNHRIYRNYFHGAPLLSSGDDNSAIGSGISRSDSKIATGNIIEYNLFSDWYGDAETISCKSSGNTVRFNTSINTNQFVNRHGNDNTWNANWFENSGGIRIHDRGQTVMGNRGVVEIKSGDITPAEWASGVVREGDNHPSAWDTVVVGNIGALRVGDRYSTDTIPARNTRVEAHQGSLSKDFEEDTIISPTTTYTVPTAIKLTPSHVGPFAPTAPRVGN